MAIGAPQWLQRARSNSQPRRGTFSYQRSRLPQWGQWLGGSTTDSSRGRRQATTLRKLPTQAPIRATTTGRPGALESRNGLTALKQASDRRRFAGQAQARGTRAARTAADQLDRHELLFGQQHGQIKDQASVKPTEHHP